LYSLSNGLIDALRWGSNLWAAQLTLLHSSNPTTILLPVSAGTFTADRNSEQRRSGELTVELLPTVPPQQVTLNGTAYNEMPLTPQDPLAPFGNEVQVAVSVIAPDLGQTTQGQNGWVPVGTFPIATTAVADTGTDLVVTMELYDRSWPFSQWALKTNYTVPAADASLRGEVIALLEYVWNTNGPGAGGASVPSWISLPSYSGTSSWACPAGVYQQGQDPWQACLDMAASAGYELFFDVNGLLTMKPTPGSNNAQGGGTLSSLPINWYFNPNEVSAVGGEQHPISGSPYSTPAGVTLSMTRDGIYNDVYVSATGPNNATSTSPSQSEAWDANPLSPTYVLGGMGDVPNFVYDSLISNGTQALAEAQYDLAVSLASAWTLTVLTPPAPQFDIDDVCAVTNPRLALSAQKFIVDTLSVDLRFDLQSSLSGRVIVPGS
jgi:hypothetical protein